MPTWAAWTGWLLTFGQVVFIVFDFYVGRRSRMRSVRRQLTQIRAMCAEAIETKEVIKTPEAAQFLRAIAHSLVGIEDHLRSAIWDKL